MMSPVWSGREVSLVSLRCRTADRIDAPGRGVDALGPVLGTRLGIEPRVIGSAGDPREQRYDEDLRDSRGCLLEAGGQVDDALAAGRFPLLLAADCSIAASTLPVVVDRRPEARILWLDAHGDFNTPETSPSGYLGGMGLSSACGRWDSDFPGTVDPTRVVMCGVRDVDPGEHAELDLAGVVRVERPADVADLLDSSHVFVHLDLDVLDPEVLPNSWNASGGFSARALRRLLTDVSEAVDEVIGLEVCGFELPADDDGTLVELIASTVQPLLPITV